MVFTLTVYPIHPHLSVFGSSSFIRRLRSSCSGSPRTAKLAVKMVRRVSVEVVCGEEFDGR